MVKKSINMGVCKINVNTECQLAFTAEVRKYIEEGKDLVGKGFDPRKLLKPAQRQLNRLSAIRWKCLAPLEKQNKLFVIFYKKERKSRINCKKQRRREK